MTPERVKPYDNTKENKGEQVEQMFDSIAPAYDFMNTAMTFGLHRRWRNSALKELCAALKGEVSSPQIRVLDLACGTGDVTLKLAEMLPEAMITGADLSRGMLREAEKKLERMDESVRRRVCFMQADALALPFADNEFDAVTIAYGVRNFENLSAGYSEMRRVMRPGGFLCVIELCEPCNPLMRAGYKFYSRCLIPLVGRLVSRDRRAYSYLPESIAASPQRREMSALQEAAGLNETSWRTLAPGVCAIYSARK